MSTPTDSGSSVSIQISFESVPSTPSWFGEVAAFAQVMTHLGLLKAIQEYVRFARALFGKYDTIDFVVVLIGYALSGERTLKAFYERLLPFADPFMALFGRRDLPDRSTLSVDHGCRCHQTSRPSTCAPAKAGLPHMNGFHDRGTERSRTRCDSSVSRQPVVMVTVLAELATSMS